MNRVVAAPVSAFFAAEHARHGVEIVTNAAVAALEGDGRVQRVVCADGRAFAADLAVIGIGAVPNDELARDAGLEVDNGVVVDAFGRTSDPAIFAAGDVTNHPNALFDRRMRLESVHNAMEQAKAVARTIAGQPQAYADVPWFWSDQYDLKLQIAGVGDPDDELILRGDPATRAFSCLHLRAGRLVAIDCVNRGADFLAAKKLIAERRPIDLARAADPEIRLGGALRTAQASWSRMIRSNMPRATGCAGGDHDPAAGDHGVDLPIVVEGHEVGVQAGGDPALAREPGRVRDVGGDHPQRVGGRQPLLDDQTAPGRVQGAERHVVGDRRLALALLLLGRRAVAVGAEQDLRERHAGFEQARDRLGRRGRPAEVVVRAVVGADVDEAAALAPRRSHPPCTPRSG